MKAAKIIIAIYFVIFLPVVVFADAAKVAIVPFTIHADKDYTFLQRGIVEMLTSRLSAPGKVEVIDPIATDQALAGLKGQSGDNLALAVGNRLKADYAINGSITVLGESVSIDAKMLDISGKRPPLSFFKQAQGMGAVIPQINLLAADINQQVFDIQPPAAAAPAVAPAPAPAVVAAPLPAPVGPDVHMHPEKLLQGGQPVSPEGATSPLGGGAAGKASAPNPAFTTATSAQSDGHPNFWKGRTHTEVINGIDVGDVDGDGLLETVVVTPENLYVYRYAHERRQTVAEIKADRFARNISVDIGDINGNGTPEIFVTAFNSGLNGMASRVLEFDGKAFKTIVEKSFYFYRIIQRPQGVMLLGQKQVSKTSVFGDAIFEMKYEGGDYVPVRKIVSGGNANLLGLTVGDIMQNGAESMAIIDQFDQLKLILPSGKAEWTSDERYGGTTLYYWPPARGTGNDAEKEYLPIRVRLVDLNRDGKAEVLAAANEGMMSRTFAQQRFFKKSYIEALSWDGLGMASQWRTQPLNGRTQDFVVADFDNDGGQELLIAVVTKEGAVIFTDAQSSLIAFDLNIPK